MQRKDYIEDDIIKASVLRILALLPYLLGIAAACAIFLDRQGDKLPF